MSHRKNQTVVWRLVQCDICNAHWKIRQSPSDVKMKYINLCHIVRNLSMKNRNGGLFLVLFACYV